MLLLFINKLLIMLLSLSILNLVRHFYFFIQSFIVARSGEISKYSISDKQILVLGFSVSYITMCIVTGVTF
jgi:hypothetical protein